MTSSRQTFKKKLMNTLVCLLYEQEVTQKLVLHPNRMIRIMIKKILSPQNIMLTKMKQMVY